MTRRIWTRSELIVAFNLYCKLRFGQCHGRNPQVVELARVLHRTPNAVAMKLCNFASFDSAHQRRGVAGLTNVGRADKAIWDEFNSEWNRLAVESEQAMRQMLGERGEEPAPDPAQERDFEQIATDVPSGPTESLRLQHVRLGQAFFRATVLASYNEQCCVCQLPCKALLIASHIIPWAKRPELRLDPRNGLCLCAMHDKAFDRGLLAINSEMRIILSRSIEASISHPIIESMFIAFRDQSLHLPEKFESNPSYLEYHRINIYQAAGAR
jgi:putative restriction endonuclease